MMITKYMIVIIENIMLPPGIYDHTTASAGGTVVGKLQITLQQNQQQQQQQQLQRNGCIDAGSNSNGNGNGGGNIVTGNGQMAAFMVDDGRPLPPPPPHVATHLNNVVAGEIGRAEELVTVITEQVIEQSFDDNENSLDEEQSPAQHKPNHENDVTITTPSTSIIYNGNHSNH